MSTLRLRSRQHRQAARHARALRQALESTTSRAVRNELLAMLGR